MNITLEIGDNLKFICYCVVGAAFIIQLARAGVVRQMHAQDRTKQP